jgi:hypothetical protein
MRNWTGVPHYIQCWTHANMQVQHTAPEVVLHLRMHPPASINLNANLCIVDWVRVGNKQWGILDHSGDYMQTMIEDSHGAEATV